MCTSCIVIVIGALRTRNGAGGFQCEESTCRQDSAYIRRNVCNYLLLRRRFGLVRCQTNNLLLVRGVCTENGCFMVSAQQRVIGCVSHGPDLHAHTCVNGSQYRMPRHSTDVQHLLRRVWRKYSTYLTVRFGVSICLVQIQRIL